MTGFAAEPDISPADLECKRWRLRAPFSYLASVGTITVPAGFESDGATVPRLAWVFYPPSGALLLPALVHDLLYTLLAAGTPHPLAPTRAAADAILRQAAIDVAIPPADAWVIWAAVRAFGAGHAAPIRSKK